MNFNTSQEGAKRSPDGTSLDRLSGVGTDERNDVIVQGAHDGSKRSESARLSVIEIRTILVQSARFDDVTIVLDDLEIDTLFVLDTVVIADVVDGVFGVSSGDFVVHETKASFSTTMNDVSVKPSFSVSVLVGAGEVVFGITNFELIDVEVRSDTLSE